MVRMPHWPLPTWRSTTQHKLDRMLALLNSLDNPHKKIPPVVHITGTNGKGSSAAFLRAICEAAGYKVHCYTSPHLLRFNERIRVAGEEISDDFLWEVMEETRIAASKNSIDVTFFEGITVGAFLSFARVPADITIVEVGMGGRLDATNVFSAPILTMITSISYDHTEYLGNSLSKIAFEKAGIMRPFVPCVISQQTDEVNETLFSIAENLKVPTIVYEYDFIARKNPDKSFIYESPQKTLFLPAPSLIGDHQYINCSNAVTAALNLHSLAISDAAITKGLIKATWPARLQKLTSGNIVKSLPSGSEIIIDGAHNDSGAQILSLWLEEEQNLPTYLILGMTRGRNVVTFLSHFTGKVTKVLTLLIENEPSSYSAQYCAAEAYKAGLKGLACNFLEEAIELAAKDNHNQPIRVLICGSLYLAAAALELNQRV